MQNTTISSIAVEGLHDQFSVELNFTRGLNVLYGKNGRGKTTLLHILANVLELDFDRFRYLQFRRIRITTHAGACFEIERGYAPDFAMVAILDGEKLSTSSDLSELSPVDRQRIRNALGPRSVYLPAFRAILERVRSDTYAEPPKDPSYERIRDAERAAQREADPARRRVSYPPVGRYDQGSITARKTVQCREWFGPFVPVVRYPSIIEVVDGLSAEFRDAQLETGMQERRMLSQMFVEVFKALLSEEEVPSESEVDTLMERVRYALEQDEESTDYEASNDRIGVRLAQEAAQVKLRGSHQGSSAERRVLKLYAQMLERRNQERQTAFVKVRQFEFAVNKFLDDKTLHVSDDRRSNQRIPSRGVYVQTDGHRKYPLSSLSSGERQVLTMLFSATRMATAGGIFLIDEPELSLHIDWQRIILSELMAQAGDRQIIACTHSPEVGADHMDALQMFSPTPYLSSVFSRPDEGSDALLDDTL